MLSEPRLLSSSKARKEEKAIRLDFARGWAGKSGADPRILVLRGSSSLRRFRIGRYEASSLLLTAAEVGDAGTECPRASGTPRSRVGGEGPCSRLLGTAPSEGAGSDWLFFLDAMQSRPGARPAACPPTRGCCSLSYLYHSLSAERVPEPQRRGARRGAPGPRRRAGDAPEA